jgi:hypothetical protein
MFVRTLKPNTTLITVRSLNHIRMMDSFRSKTHGSTELQHNDRRNEIDHHDPYKAIYERLWQNKATLDWLPKAEENWQEINGKKQAYYNKILVSGAIAFILSFIYLKTVIITKAGALSKPPYDVIGNEDFPGSKYK